MSYHKFTKSLSEDFKELTPDKESRVKKRVGELGRDIQVSGARMKQLSRAPLGRFRPKIQAEKERIAKSAQNKNKLIGHATDALIRANISKQASTIKRINDLKQSLKDLGEMKTFSEFITEARQRIAFTRLHHGSDIDSIESIRRSGPKSSKEGSQGPGHYVTPDEAKARKYAEFTSKQRGKEPSVVSYLVPTRRITRVDTIPRKLTKEPQVSITTPIIHNTRTGHAVIDPNYARNRMIKPSSIIRIKNKKK